MMKMMVVVKMLMLMVDKRWKLRSQRCTLEVGHHGVISWRECYNDNDHEQHLIHNNKLSWLAFKIVVMD